MSNKITRPIGSNLGFDEYGQLWASWYQGESTYSTIVPDLRDKKCVICGQGWPLTGEAYRDHYNSRLVDDFDQAHKNCWIGYLGAREASMWQRMLCYPVNREDFIPFRWERIPNEYGGAWNTPWYKIKPVNRVPWMKLGSRKRVYHMSLHDLRPEQVAAFEEMFKAEQVTQEARGSEALIHAHTEEDAARYLLGFSQIIRMDPPLEDRRGALVFNLELPKKEIAESAV